MKGFRFFSSSQCVLLLRESLATLLSGSWDTTAQGMAERKKRDDSKGPRGNGVGRSPPPHPGAHVDRGLLTRLSRCGGRDGVNAPSRVRIQLV